jgi:hypothetical protein
MLDDIVSSWTRIVSRMSTASFEYGFSDGLRSGPGAEGVFRDLSTAVA